MAHLSEWHDYFIVVGGGAAALTGLVFVAMTLHLEDIVNDPVHRHRARTILAGLTAVFIRCSLALMGGQNGQAIGAELIDRGERARPLPGRHRDDVVLHLHGHWGVAPPGRSR